MAPSEDFEEMAQRAEIELLDPDTPHQQVALVTVRLFRKWYASEWKKHNEAEEQFRQQIKTWVWGLRIGMLAIVAMGGLIAWALSIVAELIPLLK